MIQDACTHNELEPCPRPCTAPRDDAMSQCSHQARQKLPLLSSSAAPGFEPAAPFTKRLNGSRDTGCRCVVVSFSPAALCFFDVQVIFVLILSESAAESACERCDSQLQIKLEINSNPVYSLRAWYTLVLSPCCLQTWMQHWTIVLGGSVESGFTSASQQRHYRGSLLNAWLCILPELHDAFTKYRY